MKLQCCETKGRKTSILRPWVYNILVLPVIPACQESFYDTVRFWTSQNDGLNPAQFPE